MVVLGRNKVRQFLHRVFRKLCVVGRAECLHLRLVAPRMSDRSRAWILLSRRRRDRFRGGIGRVFRRLFG